MVVENWLEAVQFRDCQGYTPGYTLPFPRTCTCQICQNIPDTCKYDQLCPRSKLQLILSLKGSIINS
jgi:hypothetical protein